MTRKEAERRLNSLNGVIWMAARLIEAEEEVLEQFLAEARDADTIMPILDPTLWMNRERQRAEAIVTPVYEAARALLAAHRDAGLKFADWPKEERPA